MLFCFFLFRVISDSFALQMKFIQMSFVRRPISILNLSLFVTKVLSLYLQFIYPRKFPLPFQVTLDDFFKNKECIDNSFPFEFPALQHIRQLDDLINFTWKLYNISFF